MSAVAVKKKARRKARPTLRVVPEPRGPRARKKPTPPLRLRQGDPVPHAPPGMVPADVTIEEGVTARRVSIKVKKSLFDLLEPSKVRFDVAEEGDLVELAMSLGRLVQGYIKFGNRLVEPEREMLQPVLQTYAEQLQKTYERNLSLTLAHLAVVLADESFTAGQVLDSARKARRESEWLTDNGEPITVDALAFAARRPSTGRPPKLKTVAARVYRLLAWDSRADVPPTELDERDRGAALSRLLDRQIEQWMMRKEFRRKHPTGKRR